jgi:hypothetical protein
MNEDTALAIATLSYPPHAHALFEQILTPATVPHIPIMHLKARFYWLMGNQLKCKQSPNCDALASECALIEGELYNRALAEWNERYHIEYQDKAEWSC